MPYFSSGSIWCASALVMLVCVCESTICWVEADERERNYAATERYYQSILNVNRPESPNLAALTQFFSLMPKGGDLHHHYSGAIYAETFLDWVAAEGHWIHQQSLKIEIVKTRYSLTVAQLRANDALYRKLLSTWSDKDFDDYYHEERPPDAQFFSTFAYFGPLASRHIPAGLRTLKQRALEQNVQYLETMLASVEYARSDAEVDAQLWALQKQKSEASIGEALATFARKIDADPKFVQTVKAFVKKITADHRGLDDQRFTMRYQTYVYRDMAPSLVFASLYAGFLAANESELLVGVNIVGPENGVIALRDYWLHMQMFQWLRAKFPRVRIAMHAGELTLGMVRPEELTFHIRDAIQIAGARRIGHGVDIMHEANSLELLQEMKNKRIAVEINLTSNEFILGVSGAAHPVTIYLRHGVPLVISTDDPGVSRNDLASQYTLLAARYGVSYAGIKDLVTNSIRYSFLDERLRQRHVAELKQRFATFESKVQKFTEGAEGAEGGEGAAK